MIVKNKSQIYSYTDEACPVCKQVDKGCKKALDTGLNLCKVFNGQPTSTHVYLKQAVKNPDWAIYVPNEDYKVRQRSQEAQRLYELAQFHKSLPSVEARDTVYKEVTSQLSLDKADKQNLLDRRLTPEAIDRLNFRSISFNQNVITSQAIAGFTGEKYVGSSGTIIPITNIHGQVVGSQIKTNVAGKKYTWLVTKDREGNTIQSSHLNNGELPLQVAIKDSEIIGLCEGTLKPIVASERLGINMIGASGGSFLASFETLKETLIKLCGNRKVSLSIYPDGKCVVNKQVFRQTLHTAHVLKESGFEVMIGYWGQFWSKDCGDIDEIESLDQIQYLTTEVFECLTGMEQYDRQQITNYLQNNLTTFNTLQIALDHVLNGFGNKYKRKVKEATNLKADESPYNPGELPEKEANKSSRYILRQSGDRHLFYEEAIRMGYKHILDTSGTGAGKTYAITQFNSTAAYPLTSEADRRMRRVFAIMAAHRQPPTKELEEKFVEMPVRNNGMYEDTEKRTPLGKPVRYSSNKKGAIFTQDDANCFQTDRHRIYEANGLDSRSICLSCVAYHNCKNYEASHVKNAHMAGYKRAVVNALRHDKIRSNIMSLTPEMIDSRTTLIIDEYTKSLNALSLHKIQWAGLISSLGGVLGHTQNRKLKDLIKDILGAICVLKSENGFGKYGMNTNELHNKLSHILPEDISWLDELEGEIDAYVEKDTNTPPDNKESLSQRRLTQQQIQNETAIQLGGFFKAICKQPGYSIHITENIVTIASRNQRIAQIIEKAPAIVYQDATGNRESLAFLLGIKPEEILEVSNESRVPANLEIIHINGISRLSGERTDTANRRVELIRNTLIAQHGEKVGFIERKAFAKEGDLIHHADSRGSNRFEDKQVVAAFGSLEPNLSSTLLEYEAYAGKYVDSLEDQDFQDYVTNYVIAETIQEIGRLRANRSPNIKKTYYLVGDFDATFLSELGFNYTTKHVAEAFDLGKDDPYYTRKKIVEAIKEMKDECQRIIQSNVARAVGVTQGRISQLTSIFGGWEAFTKLLDRFFNGGGEESVLTDKERLVLKSFMPTLFNTHTKDGEAVYQENIDVIKKLMTVIDIETVIEYMKRHIVFLSLSERLRLINWLVDTVVTT